MDYIKEMNAFYDLDMANQLTPNAISLYFALLNIANKLYWKADFVVSNLKLQSLSGIDNRATLNRARNALIQKGLIKYKPSGKANQAGAYTIIGCVSLLNQDDDKNVTQNDAQENDEYQEMIKNVTQDDTQNDTQSDTQDDTQSVTINKQNKTKQKQNKKDIYTPDDKKIKFAEFVSMTNDEYQKLLIAYGEENTKRMIEVLDNYKGATGKKYKSDYRAILNWVVDRVMKEERKYAVNSGDFERHRQSDRSPAQEKREDKLFSRGLD